MEEMLEQRLATGMAGCGIAVEQMMFIDFILPEPTPTRLRVYLPLVQIEAVQAALEQLRTIQGSAQAPQ